MAGRLHGGTILGNFGIEAAVSPVGTDHCVGRVSGAWEIWGPNGGYFASPALRAEESDSPFTRPASAGDEVWFDRDEWHWHGASADCPMVRRALQEAADDGTEAAWGDHVTDDEYDR
jgi:hypothetical protein